MDNYVEFQLLSEVREQTSEVSGLHTSPNSHSETGNPPEGWESEGQIRNSALCSMPYAWRLEPLPDKVPFQDDQEILDVRHNRGNPQGTSVSQLVNSKF